MGTEYHNTGELRLQMGRYAPSTHTVPTPVAQQKNYPVGVYEGGGYSFKGIYRPAYNCRMKTNEHPEFLPGLPTRNPPDYRILCAIKK